MPQLTERFHLSSGMVEITYPATMTADDLADFVDTAALVFRRLRRQIEAEPPSSLTQTAEGQQPHQTADGPSGGAHSLPSTRPIEGGK